MSNIEKNKLQSPLKMKKVVYVGYMFRFFNGFNGSLPAIIKVAFMNQMHGYELLEHIKGVNFLEYGRRYQFSNVKFNNTFPTLELATKAWDDCMNSEINRIKQIFS